METATGPSLSRDSSATPPPNFQDPALYAYRAKHHHAYLERKRREVLAHGGTVGPPALVRSSDVSGSTKHTGAHEVKSETIHRSTLSSTVATAVPSPTWKPSTASSDPKSTPTSTTISSHHSSSKPDSRMRRSGTKESYRVTSSNKPLVPVASSPNLSSHGQTRTSHSPPNATIISRRVIESSTQPPFGTLTASGRPHSKSHIGTSPPSLSASSENWATVPTISPQPAPILPAKNSTHTPSEVASGQAVTTTAYSTLSPSRPRRAIEQPTSSTTVVPSNRISLSQLKKNAREVGPLADTSSGMAADSDRALAKALQEEEDARLARDLALRESRAANSLGEAGDDAGLADYISKHGVRPPDKEFTERLIPDHNSPNVTAFATSLGVEIPATTAVGDPVTSTYPRTSTVYRYETAGNQRGPNGNNFNAVPGTTSSTRLRPFNQQVAPAYPSKSTVIRRSAYGEGQQVPTSQPDPMALWNSLSKRANGAAGVPPSTRVRDTSSRNGLMTGESLSFEQAPAAYRPFGSSSHRSASSGREHSSPSLQTPSPPAPSSGEAELDEDEQLRLAMLESERVYKQEQARRR